VRAERSLVGLLLALAACVREPKSPSSGTSTRTVTVADAGGDVDPVRVYAAGISNGGIMAYRLACATRLFAAIGPDSATRLGDCPNPAPVSVLHIHGTADENIPDVVARRREIDRCPSPATSTSGPVTTSIARCPDGRTVELVTITGAGHQWPGAAGTRLDRHVPGIDPPPRTRSGGSSPPTPPRLDPKGRRSFRR
jgi:polyhydroxybutyrate depolymerase